MKALCTDHNDDPAHASRPFDKNRSGFVKTMWCGNEGCEVKMKEIAGVSSRCIPFAQEPLGDTCPVCGRAADKMIVWGIAY